MKILYDEPMAGHTTMRVGGPADRLITVSAEEELLEILKQAEAEGVPHVVIGNGSNLLVSDEGYRGWIITTAGGLTDIRTEGEHDGEVLIRAESGATLAAVAKFARDCALTGLEFAAGIPGTVGGGVVMNAGAYGGECKDVIQSVRVIRATGERGTLTNEELHFGYRTSALKRSGEIVSAAVFSLRRGDQEVIEARMEELAVRRREKQPLSYPSAGSTWKRPEGLFAARLIEEAGCKGLAVRDAQISEKHAGFLINKGKATAADICALMCEVERRVFENSGIRLEREVLLLGF
ncbi:MAG: UDP-N-acetylmuramate dehydrogenase [Lachnospiraceae bacterium]|nr:UDP-N-acetylmuramate dehydrogenase [Lachnospiraceae bacterium]